MSSSSQSSPKSPSPSQPRYRDFTKIQSFWLKQNTPRSLSSDGPDVEDVEENEDLLILESQLSDRIYELNQSLKSINSNHGSVLQKENEKFFIQKKQLKYNHLSNIKDLKLIKLDNLKLLKEIGYKYNLLEIQLKDLKNLEEDLYNKINNYDGDLSIISEKNSKQLLISELKEEISDITEKINENNLKIDNLNEIIKSGNDDYKETLDKYLKEVKMRRNLEQIILDYKGKLCCYINLNNNNNNNLEEEMQLETEKEMENEIIIDEKQIKFTSLNQEFNLDGIFTNIPDYSLTISIALKDIIVKGKDISIINPNIVSSSTNNNFSSSIFKNFEIILNSTVDTCELKRQKYGNDDNNFVYGISFQIISFNSENHNDDDIIDIIKLISNNNLETTLTTTVGDRNDEVTCLNNLFSISTTKVKYNKDDYDNFKSQLESYFLQNYNNKNNVLFKFYISSFDKLKNLKKSNSINFINFCSGSDYISTNVISNILNPSLTLPSLSLPPPPPQQQQQEEDISSDSNNDETSMSATVKSSTPKPRLIQDILHYLYTFTKPITVLNLPKLLDKDFDSSLLESESESKSEVLNWLELSRIIRDTTLPMNNIPSTVPTSTSPTTATSTATDNVNSDKTRVSSPSPRLKGKVSRSVTPRSSSSRASSRSRVSSRQSLLSPTPVTTSSLRARN